MHLSGSFQELLMQNTYKVLISIKSSFQSCSSLIFMSVRKGKKSWVCRFFSFSLLVGILLSLMFVFTDSESISVPV